MRGLGLGGIGLAAGLGCAPPSGPPDAPRTMPAMPAPRSRRHRVARALTPARFAHHYNNFYEFGPDKEAVARRAARMPLRPWTLEVGGLVDRPGVHDIDALLRRMPLEERVYRFRCVEAWSMVVPWTGFPLSALLREVGVRAGAHYVRFETFGDAAIGPGIAEQSHYRWPYVEALRLDEATHDLTLLATGIYGRALPPQHGAPLRLVVPWKYGFKSIKSLVRIDLVGEKPTTFWHGLYPREYGFLANVDPATPHPRWSQARERSIATGAWRPTRAFNGYGEEVAALYR